MASLEEIHALAQLLLEQVEALLEHAEEVMAASTPPGEPLKDQGE